MEGGFGEVRVAGVSEGDDAVGLVKSILLIVEPLLENALAVENRPEDLADAVDDLEGQVLFQVVVSAAESVGHVYDLGLGLSDDQVELLGLDIEDLLVHLDVLEV